METQYFKSFQGEGGPDPCSPSGYIHGHIVCFSCQSSVISQHVPFILQKGKEEDLIINKDKAILRKLVTGQFMPQSDHYSRIFGFQTVFHRTNYIYCCCPCAFEHEFLVYLSEDGTINETVLERVLENIVNGKCPHTEGVPTSFIKETSIYGFHITAAVGPLRAVKNYSPNYFYKRGGIFNLDPYQIGVLKNKPENLELLNKAYVMGCRICNANSPNKKRCLIASRLEESPNTVQLQFSHFVEICAKYNSGSLMNCVLNSDTYHDYNSVARSLQYSLIHDHHEVQKCLLKYITARKRRNKEVYAQSAIICDQPSLVTKILNRCSTDQMTEDARQMLLETCLLLNRREYRTILNKSCFNFKRARSVNSTLLLQRLVHVLNNYSEGLLSEDQSIIKDISSNISADSIDGTPGYEQLSLLSLFLKKHEASFYNRYIFQNYRPIIDTLLSFGANIDYVNSEGMTPLEELLSFKERVLVLSPIRQLIEILIYENSNTKLNISAIRRGLECDSALQKMNSDTVSNIQGSYITDGKEHAKCGHDDAATFALNFMGPLLIECGYPVTREELTGPIENEAESIHPAVHEYIQQCLDFPRPLILQCRDMLRCHFKGREIHKFVKSTGIPKHIGDFILLKPILKNI